jgi:hypothetical protein
MRSVMRLARNSQAVEPHMGSDSCFRLLHYAALESVFSVIISQNISRREFRGASSFGIRCHVQVPIGCRYSLGQQRTHQPLTASC